MPHIALVDLSQNISNNDLQSIRDILEFQANDQLRPFWPAIGPTTVSVLNPNQLSVDHWPIFFKDSININTPSFGFHRQGPDFDNGINGLIPYAVVSTTKGDWKITASHEMCEMLVDPSGTTTIIGPSRDVNNSTGVNYLLEVCDPCQSGQCSYKINDISVSDFCTQAYYGLPTDPQPNNSKRFSFNDTLRGPFDLRPGGYFSYQLQNQWWIGKDTGFGLAFGPHPPVGRLKGSIRSIMDRLSPLHFPPVEALANASLERLNKRSPNCALNWNSEISRATKIMNRPLQKTYTS